MTAKESSAAEPADTWTPPAKRALDALRDAYPIQNTYRKMEAVRVEKAPGREPDLQTIGGK